jgi:hypothetical protein
MILTTYYRILIRLITFGQKNKINYKAAQYLAVFDALVYESVNLDERN